MSSPGPSGESWQPFALPGDEPYAFENPGPSSSSSGGGKVKSAKKPTYESLKKFTVAQLKVRNC